MCADRANCIAPNTICGGYRYDMVVYDRKDVYAMYKILCLQSLDALFHLGIVGSHHCHLFQSLAILEELEGRHGGNTLRRDKRLFSTFRPFAFLNEQK